MATKKEIRPSRTNNIMEIAGIFAKLGFTAFGGPAAHIAMMDDELVEKRRWMSRAHFLDLIGATSLIPGPNSTEIALHCGLHRGGLPGMVVAGIAFILPAFFLTLSLAILYMISGQMPALEPVLSGIRPAMIVVIAFAAIKLSKKVFKTSYSPWIGLVVLGLAISGFSEILALVVGGLLGLIWVGLSRIRPSISTWTIPAFLLPLFQDESGPKNLALLFWECLKIGAVLYGSGYILIAYAENAFVHRLNWLPAAQLLDAIAIGQLTPGPVLTTATVIGYMVLGLPGAILASVGIFLPSFFFVIGLNPVIPHLRKSALASGFLDGVNASAVALMIYVCGKLGLDLLANWESLAISVTAVWISWKKPFGAGSISLVLISGTLGYIFHLF